MTPDDKTVERVARAICCSGGRCWAENPGALSEFAEHHIIHPECQWRRHAFKARAAIAVIEQPGWKPISEAPKSTATGRRVHGVYLLGFCPEEGATPDACLEVIWWEPLEKGGKGCWYCNGYETHPTHFRPLPSPPTKQTGKEG